MGFSNDIKTILKLDDSDWKKALDSINQAEKEYFRESKKNSETLINQREKLSKADELRASELQRINKDIAKAEQNKLKAIETNNKLLEKSFSKRLSLLKQERTAVISGSKVAIDTTKKQIKTTQEKIRAQEQYNKVLKQAKARHTENTSVIKKSTKANQDFTNSIVRHLRQIETLIVAYFALRKGFDVTIGKGIEVNRMVEDNTSGIAALLSANTRMVLSNGEVVDSYEKFKIGGDIAAETMESLRKASVKSFASFPQLTEIFQQAIGQTLSMGESFGTTTDQIINNTVKLSQRMSNIAGAIGMPMDRAREEIRSLLSGNASTDSLISTMIFGSPGEANKAIRDAKTRGNLGVKQMLDEMLQPFDALEEVQTFTRSLLTFEDAWSNTMRRLVSESGAFKDIQGIISETAVSINENSDDIVKSFDNVYKALKKLGEFSSDIASAILAPVVALEELKKQALKFEGTGGRLSGIRFDEVDSRVKEQRAKLKKLKEELIQEQKDLEKPSSDRIGILFGADIAIDEMQVKRLKNLIAEAEPILNRLERQRNKIIKQTVSFGNFAPEDRAKSAKDEKIAEVKINKELQTRLSLNTEVIKTAEKFIKSEDKILTLTKQRNAFSKAIAIDNKKLLEEKNKDEKSQNAIIEHRKTLQKALSETNKKINTEKKKEVDKAQRERDKEASDLEKLIKLKEEFLFPSSAIDKVNKQFAQKGRKLSSLTGNFAMSEKDWQIFGERHQEALKKAEMTDEKSQDKVFEYRFEKLKNYEDAVSFVNQEIEREQLSSAQKTVEIYRALYSSLKDGIADFVDFTGDRFLKLDSLLEGVAQSILKNMIESQIASPLAQVGTSLIGSLFGGTTSAAQSASFSTATSVGSTLGGFNLSQRLENGGITGSSDGLFRNPQGFANGGKIRGGSGVRDDLYVGRINGRDTFLKGNEGVLNQRAMSGIGESNLNTMNRTGKLPNQSKKINVIVKLTNQTSNEAELENVEAILEDNGSGEQALTVSGFLVAADQNPRIRSVIKSIAAGV